MMRVSLSDRTEAASAACTTGGLAGSSPAATPPPNLSPLDWKTPSMWDAPAEQALKLDDPTWNTHPKVSFNPAHFVVLPETLKLPQAGCMDWRDPLGTTATRINATVLPLTARDATSGDPRTVATGSPGQTTWSRMLNTPAVLQMQAPLDAQSSAAGATACALMLGGVTDLIVVDALTRTPDAADAASPHSGHTAPKVPQLTQGGKGYPVGYSNRNPAAQFLLEQVDYALPPESPFTHVRTVAHEPTRPKAGLPRGSLHVNLQAADGSRLEQPVRTYALNLNAPHWEHQLMHALTVTRLRDKTQALNLAVMCQDGAGASGVVATALHGMECLEAFNGGKIRLDGVDDLRRRLDDFILAAGHRRSPSFARLEGRALDTRKMARSLWEAWSQVFSSPESAAVKKLRECEAADSQSPKTGAADISDIQEIDSPVISPPPEFADALACQDAASTGRQQRLLQGRFTRQASNDSIDSGVTSDVSSVGSISTLPRRSAALRPVLSVTEEAFESDSEMTSAEVSPAASPAHTVQPRPAHAASSPPPASMRPAVHQRGAFVPLAADGDMPQRILHAGRNMDVTQVKASLASLQAPRPAPGSIGQTLRADDRVSDRRAVGGAVPDVGAPAPGLKKRLDEIVETRLSATGGNVDALEGISPSIRQAWAPGGPRFNAYREQVNDLAKAMTGKIGLIGYLRGRLSDPLDRALEPHTGWARDLIREVQQDLREHALAQPSTSRAAQVDPVVDQAQVAQLARQTIKRLVAEHFSELSTTEQKRWRHRVTGHSDRFEQALQRTLIETARIPKRLQPNAQHDRSSGATVPPLLLSSQPQRNARGVGPTDLRVPALQRSEETLRRVVDHDWAPRWVLEVAHEVAIGKT